ncbi:MAG: ribosome small subunit-dependent GTPase A [Oligoflexus sp.]
MSLLHNWGLSQELYLQSQEEKHLKIARVIEQQRGRYTLISSDGIVSAQISGRFQYFAEHPSEYPTIGDWVWMRQDADSELKIIERLADRKSWLSRGRPGSESKEQFICANVDYVFIASSLNFDFNPRRLERYITAAQAGKTTPVIVLTKLDLCDEVDSFLNRLGKIKDQAPVIALSALREEGIDALADYLPVGSTAALVGSSGVGKSTLINQLCPDVMQTVNMIREDDSKGRHTTSSRHMFVTKFGGLIIDTPGLREFQLSADEENLGDSFEEIELLAQKCRFRDCQHQTEPHCAVLKAIEDQELDLGRLRNYQKLQRELRHWETKHDPRKLSEMKKEFKKISKAIKKHPKLQR